MPGNQVKDWDLYHKLIAQGYSKEQAARIANAAHKKKVAKAFSSSFSSRRKRRNQLVARLKSRRKYPPPVRGGTGKQRSRVKSTLMNKVERIAKAREMMKTSEPTSIAKRIASANFAPGFQLIHKVDPKNQIFGWASVVFTPEGQVEDHEGHLIDVEDLENAAYSFAFTKAAANDMHRSEPFGRMIESMVFTPEKLKAMGLPDGFQSGWWVGMELPPDRYQSVISGERPMLSIEGSAVLEAVS